MDVFVRQRQRPQKGAGLRDQLDESAYSLSRPTPAPVSRPSWSPTSERGVSACGVYLPDLEQPRPPDLPPGLVRLRVVASND